MQNAQSTAGETALKTLVIFRDCHSKHNLLVKVHTWADELMYRRMATRRGWLVTERKGVVA